jgi:plastocyanin
MKQTIYISALILFAIAFSSCKKSNEGTPGENEVYLLYKTFNPLQLDIKQGTTVNFINKDNSLHTASEVTQLFYSGKLKGGENYMYTFSDTGVFTVFCNYHSNIDAERVYIRVK